jgi:chitinase
MLIMGGGTPLRTVLYYVNWAIYARGHNPQDLPLEKITHVLYAFANIRPESGNVYLTDPWSDTDKHYPSDSWNDVGTNVYGCVKQLFLLKKRKRSLKVLLSIGGWTYSSNFAGPAATEAGRREFASSAVSLLENLGFDGLDIDWEYPQNAAEAESYVLLLRETRRALDCAAAKRGAGCRFELSIACPAGAQNYQKLKVRDMDRYLDFWNLMAYDYAGSWDSTAGHQSNLFPSLQHPQATPFSTEAALDFYTKAGGVHPSKMVLGMPLYGRAFTGTDGPGHGYAGTGEGSWENGVWDYKALPRGSAVEHHDCAGPGACGASWSYCPHTRTMVTYDTPRMVEQKASYVREKGLGGGMWWESSGDKEGEASLVGTFVDAVGGCEVLEEGRNCLDYPESMYENVRKGFPGEGESGCL